MGMTESSAVAEATVAAVLVAMTRATNAAPVPAVAVRHCHCKAVPLASFQSHSRLAATDLKSRMQRRSRLKVARGHLERIAWRPCSQLPRAALHPTPMWVQHAM